MMKQVFISLSFILSGCSTYSVIDNITPIVVENVFQCSSGIVERSELLTKYASLKESNRSEYEIKIALEKALVGAGMTDSQFTQYNICIQELNTLQQKHKSTMSVVLSQVIGDKKSKVIDALTLTSDDGEAFSNEKIGEVSNWIGKYIPKEESKSIEINISEKIKNGTNLNKFTSNIDELNPTYYIWKTGQMKQRILVPEGIVQDASLFKYPYTIEISVPGYLPILVKLENDLFYHEVNVLKKIPVKVAVEKFSGVEHGVAERLAKSLSIKRKEISVYDPKILDKIREDMEKNSAIINRNPVIQQGFRTEMPNYVISGSVTKKLDR